ncbi:MAG: beta-ketoacyl-ACP synthase II [Pirellulaceae bacterium]|nr:beta-ketoacyl-ACP synthase II [Pirellulaceae bacterium]
MKRRVVVTGLGVVTSLSQEVDALWDQVLAGESGIHLLEVVDRSRFKVQFGGDIHDWDPTVYLTEKEAKRIDRFSQFAIAAGSDAVEHAGIDFDAMDSFRSGVILGSGIGGLNEFESQHTRLVLKGPQRVSPLTIPKLMLNAGGCNLSIRFGLRGVNYSVASACASATNAMGDAFHMIQHGGAEVIVTGGSEAAVTPMGISGFQNMRALSTRNDEPTRASRPFDVDRDGFVLSEGAGILVFEELEHAKARGAEIHAEVLGFGMSSDAGHITQPNDQGIGAAKAMSNALESGNLCPTEIDYINAHGTSTPLGDKAETAAVKSVFGDHAYNLSVSSTKSQLGHSLGASGGIELVLSIKAVQNGLVPPTINLENPDPDCDLDYTPNEPRQRKLNVVMSNSFGFGGHNASIIVGRYDRNGD